MRISGTTVAWLLVGVLLASGALAATTTTNYIVYKSDGTQQGWKNAECGLNLGTQIKPKPSVKAGFSSYFLVTKGSPGPRPIGNYWMESGQDGSTVGSPRPGQCWLGTDRYTGTKLSDITKMTYWATLDYRGCDWAPLTGTPTGIAPEYKIDWINSEPPQIQLHVKIYPANNDWAVLIYRPWGDQLLPENPGFGPRDGSLCRRWMEYDCLNQGYWLFVNVDPAWNPERDPAVDPIQAIFTWSDFIAAYPDATLATPPAPAGVAGYPNKFPFFGTAESPTQTSFNFVLGARKDWNGWFPYTHRAWYTESWNAQGAVDLLTLGKVDANQNETIEVFDFQADKDVTPGWIMPDPSYNRVKAMSIGAVLNSGGIYTPTPRDRPWVGTGQPADWWGRPDPYTSTILANKQNALQKAGNYNYLVLPENNPAKPGYKMTVGNLYAIYGVVSDLSGDFFNLNDGAGALQCYCPKASSVPIANGQYVRLVGTVYGNCAYEWYYNWLHCVEWNADPSLRIYSHLWPWRFDTYPWNVTIMKP